MLRSLVESSAGPGRVEYGAWEFYILQAQSHGYIDYALENRSLKFGGIRGGITAC